jgi:hypothetical protein
LEPNGLYRGPHGASGRQPIIHQDDRSTTDIRRRPIASIQSLELLELRILLGGDMLNNFQRHGERFHDIVIKDPHASRRNRAQGQLWLIGQSQLPNIEYLQWCPESTGDFKRYGDTTPGQRENENISIAGVGRKPFGEQTAGMCSIPKKHLPLPWHVITAPWR